MTALGWLALASAAFVGTHFLMSHPLRPAMVGALGEKGFAGVYSVVALALIYAMSRSYGPASEEAPAMLWNAGQVGWIVGSLLLWFGSMLFVGSLRRNPAFPTPGKPVREIGAARGVFSITRHPMMWGFAAWATTHAIVNPTLPSLTLSVAIAVLALGGAAGQDVKKERLIGEPWRDWERRTSFLPFGRGLAMPDGFAVIGGTLLFLAATWAHGALGYRPAGPWAFFA
ncbi:NnrU family protein [Sphingomonas sp. LY29]|uniref:NnrU family protein n=1 Tax=Sphingomonas sp. LY29 TaxID=3095341 RepID=UPI002D79208A|nr:NnrU family protein [Sphingomonas sp. LY29]WRP26268.1 NnrU family protein [Sphingomonas sp. LY29]